MTRSRLLTAVIVVLAALGGRLGYQYFVRGPAKSPVVEVPPTADREAIPVPKIVFTDVTRESGVAFTHVSGAAGKKLLPETMGGGVVVLDFDGDGRQDLLFVNSCPWPGHPGNVPACVTLYRNIGGGKFEDATAAAGLGGTLYGMGGCSGDVDNDGFPELFITGVGGNKFFRNVPAPGGGRKFIDDTAKMGLGGPGGWPAGLSADAFLAHKIPLPFGTSATFVDYDGDGKLDLFVCYYVSWSPDYNLGIDSTLTGIGRAYLQPQAFPGSQCTLYRNTGAGFVDVSAAAGIIVTQKMDTAADAKLVDVAKSLGVVVCDPDNDGRPDLLVANDQVRNFFFHNVSDEAGGRKFVEEGMKANVAYADGNTRGAMGIDWGECLPGKMAVIIANFANEPNSLLTVEDAKTPRFADSAWAFGLAGPSRLPLKFGAFFFDADLDGRLDLLTCNGHLEPDIAKNQKEQTYPQAVQLFWNTGSRGRLFEPVTAAAAGPGLFAPMVGRGAAYLDMDGNGTLDVVLCANGGPARVLRNDTAAGNNYVRLTLQGDGVTSNRSAIGAQVTVEAGGRKVRRDVAGSRGYLSQSELPVTVGLGAAAVVDKITVRWPGNDLPVQTWTNLQPGRAYTLKQGVAGAE